MTQTNNTTTAGANPPPTEAAKAKPKTVKIRTLRPVSGRFWDHDAKDFVERIVEPGNVVEAHPDDAKLLVETKFRGHFKFQGERYGEDSRQMHDYRRAEYVTA